MPELDNWIESTRSEKGNKGGKATALFFFLDCNRSQQQSQHQAEAQIDLARAAKKKGEAAYLAFPWIFISALFQVRSENSHFRISTFTKQMFVAADCKKV